MARPRRRRRGRGWGRGLGLAVFKQLVYPLPWDDDDDVVDRCEGSNAQEHNQQDAEPNRQAATGRWWLSPRLRRSLQPNHLLESGLTAFVIIGYFLLDFKGPLIIFAQKC